MRKVESHVKPDDLLGMTVVGVKQREGKAYEGQFSQLTLRGKFGQLYTVRADDEWNMSAWRNV